MAWRRRLLTWRPETSDALGSSPTARISRPHLVRYSTHHTNGTSGKMKYSTHGSSNNAGPSSGMRDTRGTLTRRTTFDFGWIEAVKNPTSPSTKTLSTSPTTNWSAGKRWLMLAWIAATIRPAIAAKSNPTHVEPVRCAPIAAENEPASIIASNEMLMVPAFSATSSPHAAKSNTAAAIAAFRYALSFVAMSPSAEKKLPMRQTRVLVADSARRRSRT